MISPTLLPSVLLKVLRAFAWTVAKRHEICFQGRYKFGQAEFQKKFGSHLLPAIAFTVTTPEHRIEMPVWTHFWLEIAYHFQPTGSQPMESCIASRPGATFIKCRDPTRGNSSAVSGALVKVQWRVLHGHLFAFHQAWCGLIQAADYVVVPPGGGGGGDVNGFVIVVASASAAAAQKQQQLLCPASTA